MPAYAVAWHTFLPLTLRFRQKGTAESTTKPIKLNKLIYAAGDYLIVGFNSLTASDDSLFHHVEVSLN